MVMVMAMKRTRSAVLEEVGSVQSFVTYIIVIIIIIIIKILNKIIIIIITIIIIIITIIIITDHHQQHSGDDGYGNANGDVMVWSGTRAWFSRILL